MVNTATAPGLDDEKALIFCSLASDNRLGQAATGDTTFSPDDLDSQKIKIALTRVDVSPETTQFFNRQSPQELFKWGARFFADQHLIQERQNDGSLALDSHAFLLSFFNHLSTSNYIDYYIALRNKRDIELVIARSVATWQSLEFTRSPRFARDDRADNMSL